MTISGRSSVFNPQNLDQAVIAIPLLQKFAEERAELANILRSDSADHKAADSGQPERSSRIYPVVIDLNLDFPGGRDAAANWVSTHLTRLLKAADDTRQTAESSKNWETSQYIFARLSMQVIQDLVKLDGADPASAKPGKRSKTSASPGPTKKHRALYRIWPDFEVHPLITKSIATVKADAAHNSFSAFGEGITWAVMDSGIHRDHPHFADSFSGVEEWFHKDFTDEFPGEKSGRPFHDAEGHGTHVAGIIAGRPASKDGKTYRAITRYFDEKGDTAFRPMELNGNISGVAPACQLVSLRVLDSNGTGSVSNLIAAINHIQEVNGFGRRLRIHGVNISLGYTFEPEWFACGQTPLCVEVDRLVKSGVVVVVAAGNTGYGTVRSQALGTTTGGLDITINDPGNAAMAITVGATHRDMPHVYGVSYFSSKGPTGDGRIKPDLVAPGEKIVSCAWGKLKATGAGGQECEYVETSGTSMAAPHVSGAIAAFMSIRKEFIGHPERVKEIFLSTATDLKRDRYFQGAGLLDLMRAIQSV